MKNTKGYPQKRGKAYEYKKAKDHGAKRIGGPSNPDAIKGSQKLEMKNWQKPVPKPEIVKAVRKNVNKFISKKGFTKPAVDYAKNKSIKLYEDKKRVA